MFTLAIGSGVADELGQPRSMSSSGTFSSLPAP
jgi:hypothetical protein